ncbi:MAG: BLUF domain-containing protein [Spirochaetia bacterium]|nr:BLUF domain-containing protein [Spirochaetia bacterium]
MKRLTYISEFTQNLSKEEIQAIGDVSVKNNQRDQLTGALLVFDRKFFQILEGPESAIDITYKRILGDPRHANVRCLEVENNISGRRFPDWGMKVVQLDETTEALFAPIKSILATMSRSHHILEVYTQPEILSMMQNGIDPMEVPLAAGSKTMIFSDVASFTTISERIKTGHVNDLLNIYFDAANKSIQRHGGHMNKFTGDGFLAYFDDGHETEALSACVEFLSSVKEIREKASASSVERLLFAGVGAARGPVVLGNFGSSIKKEFTVHGEAVNTAARLESFTRKIDSYLALSERFATKVKSQWPVKAVARYKPKGKEEVLRVYTVNHASVQKEFSGPIAAEVALRISANPALR